MPTVLVPIRTVSEMNARDHWRTVHIRKKKQQATVGLLLLAKIGLRPPPPPVVVTLVRVGKRLLDPDNLGASLKHTQDSVAKYLKVDDGDRNKVRWRYEQRIGKEYAVEITIEPMESA